LVISLLSSSSLQISPGQPAGWEQRENSLQPENLLQPEDILQPENNLQQPHPPSFNGQPLQLGLRKKLEPIAGAGVQSEQADCPQPQSPETES